MGSIWSAGGVRLPGGTGRCRSWCWGWGCPWAAWVSPGSRLAPAAPLQAVVCRSLCFIPSCQVSGAEKGGKAAGDGVDHTLPPTQALGMWPPWDPGRGLAWVPSAPGPLPSSGECVGGRCQRLACVWGGKDQLGWHWLCCPALPAPSPAGADASRWRQHWVPLPPVAFPCIPGEEGRESHRLSLQQLRLFPAHHLSPGAAWDALLVSPSAPPPAGRQGGHSLSRQPGDMGDTHNKATLGINCLLDGSWQHSGAVPAAGQALLATTALAASWQNRLCSPVLVLAWLGDTHRGASPPPAHVLAPCLCSLRKKKTN